MNLSYELILKTPALKFIKKQDKNTQVRILEALEGLRMIPPEGDVKKLKGEQHTFRLRIGTYRALFYIDQNMIGFQGFILSFSFFFELIFLKITHSRPIN
ncbi:mRNA-degrading endonuclease RelE, toxin component of the RelBE toxin-antitoxin system [Marininema mesophilum]|uniref:mRNA-degrading endonuclease RelE, toxin component of the RelBE toxin-antitoxin system n=1 Tax=Marininema mesophilum TaxID=1048340 RepID=A0A1H3D286_9BACL|nr:type II toxin-antitoxin system RelE/ParE family toxin [Marininema mesophilum]SDX59894.1 mRNA-degrading endonuclease RelE, toxin component of the RelBE toxin-antitoxin system [Marininema mesophilum]